MSRELLRTEWLTKQFGSVTVIEKIDFEVERGEVHALLGANGAGKTTLCRIIAGLIAPTEGSLIFRGEKVCWNNKQQAQAAGIEIVQQELNLIPTLDVAENLFLSRLPNRLGWIERRKLVAQSIPLLAKVGLSGLDPRTTVSKLGVGQQQMIEIAKSIGQKCELLILDEPTAALTQRESELLFEQICSLKAQGVGIIYISHRLDEIKRISDRLTILRDGKKLFTASTAEITIPEVIRAMSGDCDRPAITNERPTSLNQDDACRSVSDTKVALRVDKLTSGLVKDVSFSVKCGERFGMTGLVGSGRTELLRAIFGADHATSGWIYLGEDPKPYRFASPAQGVKHGLAMVTEDRKRDGLMLPRSIQDNTALASLWSRFSWLGGVREAALRRDSIELCHRLATRCTGVHQPVGSLSGGNQQKVVLAKWLLRESNVFLFDEPTRGIDVAARQLIYQVIYDLARQGKGIIMVSSDLEELLETCDRIAVMSQGRLIEIFQRGTYDRERIMNASFAGHRDVVGVDHV